jgi:iron complex transport system ATP-binding protein
MGEASEQDDAVTDLLAALAARSPYGALDPPAVATALGAPLAAAGPLIDYVGSQLGTTDPQVAASVAFQGVCSRLAAAVLVANELLGVAIDVPFASLRWRGTDTGLRLGLTDLVAGSKRPWADAIARLVDDAFEPWAVAVRRHVRIGQRLLWGNAAASLLGATNEVVAAGGPAGAGGLAGDALAALPRRDLATVTAAPGRVAFRRLTCCLIDKAPGYGRCGECSLDHRV